MSTEYVEVNVKGQIMTLPRSILTPAAYQAATTTSLLASSANHSLTELNQQLLVEADKLDKLLAKPASVTARVMDQRLDDVDQSVQQMQSNLESLQSHCSAAGSCFSEVNSTMPITSTNQSARLFVFPEFHSGYEVVYPEDVAECQVDAKCETVVEPSTPTGK